MQLGFVSAILPDLSLGEVVFLASNEGFDCVELMCWPTGKAERRYAGVTHVDVNGFGRAEAEKVLECVDFRADEDQRPGVLPQCPLSRPRRS